MYNKLRMANFLKIRLTTTIGKEIFNLSRCSSTTMKNVLPACFVTSLITSKAQKKLLEFHLNDIFAQTRSYAKKSQGKAPKGGKTKTVLLSDEELGDVINLSHYRHQLSAVISKMTQDFIDHISIHSSTGNINQLPVTIENETYPVNELAQISKKGQNLICLNFTSFPEGLKPTLQALTESGTGFNPQQEGTMIYINIPKITREHRETLAKNAKSLCSKSKEEVRNIQNHYVREAKKQTELSEDLVFNATKKIMSIAEESVTELEKIMKTRQIELLKED